MKKPQLFLAALSLAAGISTSPTDAAILVQEDFSGLASSDLNGTAPDIGPGTWVSQATSIKADGSTSYAGNSLAYLSLGNLINDAKGTASGLFELTVTLDHPTAGSWYSVGFGQPSAPSTTSHFLSRNGVATIILRTSGELDMWAGNGFTPNGLYATGSSNAIDGPNGTAGPRTLTVELDLRDWNGTNNFGTVTYFDSQLGELGSYNYTNVAHSTSGNPETDPLFNSIMLSGSNGTVGNYSNLTLTQVPEPGSLALLGLGSLMVARRRRQS